MPAAHGTRSRYTAGCECAKCRRANTEYIGAHAASKLTLKQLRDKVQYYSDLALRYASEIERRKK